MFEYMGKSFLSGALITAMFTIRNTNKTLIECLSLNQKSANNKSILERIEMNPTLLTKLYNKLVEVNPCVTIDLIASRCSTHGLLFSLTFLSCIVAHSAPHC